MTFRSQAEVGGLLQRLIRKRFEDQPVAAFTALKQVLESGSTLRAVGAMGKH